MRCVGRRKRLARSAALLRTVCLLAAGCASADAYRVELDRGEHALSAGQPADAEDAYLRALNYRPGGSEALVGLARSALARADGEGALAALARAEHGDPDHAREWVSALRREALLAAARQSFERGDSAGTLERLARLEALDPGHPGRAELEGEALLAEAARLYVAGRRAEAEVLGRVALGTRSSGSDAALALAEALFARGRLGPAISVLSDALLRHPGDPRLGALMDRTLEIRYPD